GYFTTGLIVAGAIAAFAIARKFKLNSILSFWAIYILTRPLGASIGDYLSQPQKYGGLGLGATKTTLLFVGAIIISVAYLAMSKRDVTKTAVIEEEIKYKTDEKGGLMQTAIVVVLLVALSGIGYDVRQSTLNAEISNPVVETTDVGNSSQPAMTKSSTTVVGSSVAPKPVTSSNPSGAPIPKPTSTLGDLSSFRTITNDTLGLVNQGDLSGAKDRIGDLEYEWDNAEARLKPKDSAKWHEVDDAIDEALRQVRSVHPNAQSEKTSLEALLDTLN
ncbi:hypothetical protein K2Q02_01855, partial [Patescibacteria group bacterium]|nr:hypothetical protein [Patescibacteria group bacterium]